MKLELTNTRAINIHHPTIKDPATSITAIQQTTQIYTETK